MARKSHEVAIVGMGCRLPGGVGNPERLAVFLREHGDGVCLVPANRWSVEDHFDPDPKTPGKAYVRHGGFLTDDVFSFDPAPFGISPREADRLDPQQRLLLEVTWEAFEDAGIPLDSLRGSDTAAFVGGFTQDHQLIAMSDANRDLIDSHTSVGASMTVLSNRISYTFDWHGASATVDTACSSSLVAFHLACEEIRAGRSSVAIAGGVNVMLTPTTTIAMCKGQFLAPDGRSKSFDARADGYGRGEGAGIVVLKRRDLAERDGDRVLAVVCATGVNQDGRTDGMPMPNGEAQLKLARSVLGDSGLAASDIAYVEAHGTGTRAGDPVELYALGRAYGEGRDVPLVVGSVKSNVGHLEAAAGITGLVKAVLSVSRREIFPLRELTEPNPAIPFAALNIELAVEPRPWPTARRACAAVNSFGYGGTNAHAIIAEYEPLTPANSNRPLAPTTSSGSPTPRGNSRPSLVPLSAACQPALRARAADVASQCSETPWGDVAHTLACARDAMTERAVLLVHDGEGLAGELGKVAANETSERRVSGRATSERKLLWVFTGMGPQRPAMGRELYENEPIFRAAVEEADSAFRESARWSVLAAMLEPAERSSMKANFVAQPANFVLQVGLVALLRDLGVPEHGMLGHSIGELAAAWASGCLSLREAARITFHRSRLQQTKAGTGGMLAVGAKEADLAELLAEEPDLHIAAFNGPKSLTLAGPNQALARAAAALEKRGIFQRRVPVEVAYHSPELEALRPEFLRSLGVVEFDAPRQPLYSTADGVRLGAAAHDTEYWWRNARAPVLLQRALEAAIGDGFDAFLEVGPHPVLGPSIREVLGHLRRDGHLAYTMRRDNDEPTTLLRNVAELYANGTALDWSRLGHAGRRVRLPSYPFQRRTHWVESNESREMRLGRARSQPLLAQRDGGPSPRFSTPLSRPSLAYLHDHRIEGRVVFPAAGYLEAALGACIELTAECSGCVLEDVRFERVFVLRPEASPTLVVDKPSDDGYVTLYGKHRGDGWEKKAHVRVRSTTADPEQHLALASLGQDLPIELDVERLYGELAELGLEYGPAFRRLEAVSVRRDGRGGGALLARLSDVADGNSAASVHPTLLDAGFHALLALNSDATAPLVPTSIRKLSWWDAREAPRWVYGVVSRAEDDTFTAELKLAGASGRVLVDVHGLAFQPLSAGDAPAKHEAWLHVDGFEPVGPVSDLPHYGALALYGAARSLPLGTREHPSSLGGSIRVVVGSELASLQGDERLIVTFETRAVADGGVAAIDAFRALLAELGYAGGELRLVTVGAQALTSSERPDPVQAALAGFARVVMTERPELALRIIDTTPDCDGDALLALLLDPNLDEEVALRGDTLYTRKLRRLESRASAPRGSTLFSLGARPSLPPDQSAHELRGNEIEVRALAAAVHRADLTSALRPSGFGGGRRPARGRAICGQVVRVGSHVRHVRVGERVHTFYDGDLAASITVPEERVVRVPTECNPNVVAASEAYVAAWYALTEVARTTRGDTVLVEGADTPAGLAAVDVARSIGANVIATIDHAEHRESLFARGASEVLQSDDLDLETRVRAVAPAGTRAVVSVTDSIERQVLFALLGAGGHFVALTSDAAPNLRGAELPFGVSLGSVSLVRAVREAPRSYAEAARAVLARFARGELEVPAPKTFVPADAAAAFESLSFGEDAPLVLDLSAADPGVDAPAALAPFRKDRSYLVTGGLAGLGLATAEWMANLGAGTIVLASRRGVPDQEAAKSIARMRGAGAEVICSELDVSNDGSLAELLRRIRRDLPALAGVFHAATVFADGPLESITTGSLLRAMSAKARGAWLLHEQTQTDPLEHFVLFSSVSALIGNPNQAAYAAANAYLDGLADLRRAEGLPALSLSFGAIKDAGVVARDAATRAHLASLGIRPMAVRLTLAALLTAMAAPEARLGVVDMDWDRWVASFPATPWRRLSELLKGTSAAADSASALKAELAALDPDAREAHLTERLRETAAGVLRLAPENLDPVASFRNHGLDSLMALELQAAIDKATGISVPTIEILAGVSVRDLVAFVLARLEAPAPAPAGARAPLVRSAPAAIRRPLQERLLAQICVQPPYFALEDLVARGEWVHARARAVPSPASEAGLVSCAEAARHLAIAGSCAVSLASPIAGRVYYPVWKASYDVAWRTAALRAAPLETLLLSARCLDFDEKASRARAETRLLDEHGEILQTLLVDYHVIPERHFRQLFAAESRPTAEATSPDPYASWVPLPSAPLETARGSRLALGTVVPEQCLGHFVGYPALPVSIMTRYAVDLVAEARAKLRSTTEAIWVTSGDVETKAFVFAGQVATLEVWRGEAGPDGSERWHGEVTGNGQLAASFRFDVRGAEPRTSGIYDTSLLQPAKVAD